MLILGIETSCDETSASIVRDGKEILSNVILSQPHHSRFGGVVPEVASRAHLKTIVPIYEEALAEAKVSLQEIDLFCATMGPGLIGPLLVGLTFTKGLSFATGKPFVAVNHLEGHIAANYLEHHQLDQHHLSLVVSGGHTLLIEVHAFGEFDLLGETHDDAVGEAYDKVAKVMGLGYPGGAALDALAQSGNAQKIKFPRGVIHEPDFNFSYSGLKTAVAQYIAKLSPEEIAIQKTDIAASFQEAAIEVLVEKTLRAAIEKNVRHIAISGGVAANSRLRSMMKGRLESNGKLLFYPNPRLCTDNAAMIATAGYLRFLKDGPSEHAANAIPYLRLRVQGS